MPSLNIIGNVNLTGGKYNRTPFAARGGQVATFTSGGINYTSHTFTSSGQFELIQGETQAQVLVVGGGGGGEIGGNTVDQNKGGNGGGAGGLNYTASFFLRKNPSGAASIWNVTVGSGGTGAIRVPLTSATSGSNSSFIATYSYEQVVPTYGYYGGLAPSGSGASGGGENGQAIFGDQGNVGGDDASIYTGAGGGGAATAGTASVSFTAGGGGQGKGFTLQDGTLKFYAGGGGGGSYFDSPSTAGAGGSGVGGAGADRNLGANTPGNPGTANTGGGGGGGLNANNAGDVGGGGNGGSGIVIITYPTGG